MENREYICLPFFPIIHFLLPVLPSFQKHLPARRPDEDALHRVRGRHRGRRAARRLGGLPRRVPRRPRQPHHPGPRLREDAQRVRARAVDEGELRRENDGNTICRQYVCIPYKKTGIQALEVSVVSTLSTVFYSTVSTELSGEGNWLN